MHWIFIGIMIWIGLAIAPFVLGIALVLLPGAIFGAIGATIGVLITNSGAGLVIGAVIGAVSPYLFMGWSRSA